MDFVKPAFLLLKSLTLKGSLLKGTFSLLITNATSYLDSDGSIAFHRYYGRNNKHQES